MSGGHISQHTLQNGLPPHVGTTEGAATDDELPPRAVSRLLSLPCCVRRTLEGGWAGRRPPAATVPGRRLGRDVNVSLDCFRSHTRARARFCERETVRVGGCTWRAASHRACRRKVGQVRGKETGAATEAAERGAASEG